MIKSFFNVIKSYITHHPGLSDELNRRFTTLYNKTSQVPVTNRKVHIVLHERIVEYDELISNFCMGNKIELQKYEHSIKQAKASLNRVSQLGYEEVKKNICTGILQVLN